MEQNTHQGICEERLGTTGTEQAFEKGARKRNWHDGKTKR